ncbi:MAG TPA: UbiA family prenyltransferase [Streptosporangiaceae bacterium]|nr:UbiA family prenyltransferase [Streptosporangiaceae bacterium]
MRDHGAIFSLSNFRPAQSGRVETYPCLPGYPPPAPSLPRPSRAGQLLVISPGRTLALCLAEARPAVLAIFLLRFAAGAALGWPSAGGDFRRTCGTALVWELAVFFVYLFNGVTDLNEDRINGSGRPIARGSLDPGVALAVALTSAAAAVLGALALGGATAWLVPVLVLLGYLYSGPPCYLKRNSASTAAIGMAGGLLSYLAGLTSPSVTRPGNAALTFTCFAIGAATWMGLTGTLAKDLPDIAGDTAAGRNSAAAHLGDRKARLLLSGTAITTATAFGLAALLVSPALRVPAAAMLAGAVCLAALSNAPLSQGNRSRRRRPYRVFMLTQYATHICVLVPLLAHLRAV